MLLNETPTLKVLIICKKLLKIMDKTVLYHLPECVLSNVLINSLIKTIQKKFRISLELRKIDQEEGLLLEFNHFVENMISTLVVLMVEKCIPETILEEICHCSYIIFISV